MIEMIEGMPAPVVAASASGKVTREDYESALIPAVEAMLSTHAKVRFLYVLGEGFDGYSLGAMWDDTKLGVSNLREWERIAIVTDTDWVDHAIKAFGWMLPGEVRTFGDDEIDTAKAWIVEGIDAS